MRRSAALLIAVYFILQTGAAAAKTRNLEVGASAQTMYDSNIFFTKNDRESDMVTSIGPWLVYKREVPRGTFTVDARPRYVWYDAHEDLSELNFNVSEELTRKLDKNWTVSLENENVKNNTSYLTTDLVGATGHFVYTYHSLTPAVTYTNRGTTAQISAVIDKIDYDTETISDADGQSYNFSLGQKITDQLTGLFDFTYQTRAFDNNLDIDIYLASVGVTYKPGRRWIHTFKLGGESVGQNNDADYAEEFYYYYEGSYMFTPRTSGIIRSQKQSSVIDVENNVLDIWQTTLELTHNLSPLDKIKALVTYVLAEYPSVDSQDDIWKYETTLEHVLNKQTRLNVGYSMEEKSSDFSAGYLRHVAYVEIEVNF